MNKEVRVIKNGDKLRTTKDIYLGGKLILTGTMCCAFSFDDRRGVPMIAHPISGFGDSITMGIKVRNQTMGDIDLPIDCLDLAEE